MFLDVLDSADLLDSLPDVARVEAWASSALSVWAEAPNSSELDAEFVTWLGTSSDSRAPLVVVALSNLLQLDAATVEAARRRVRSVPRWLEGVGPAEPTRAWIVNRGGVASVGIGFTMSDRSEHSLLADVVDGELDSLILGPGPRALFDGSEDLVSPEPVRPAEAARLIVDACRATPLGRWPESGYVNAAVATRRLSGLVGDDLGKVFRPARSGEVQIVVDDDRAELNQWALSVLDGAGVGPGKVGDVVLTHPLDPSATARYPQREREAFGALEWADWLGMVIGLCRSRPGVSVEPSMLVDLINRCPEVTSVIPRSDRAYYEWVISMVLPLWRRGEVIEGEHTLSPDGAPWLVHALRLAWQQGR